MPSRYCAHEISDQCQLSVALTSVFIVHKRVPNEAAGTSTVGWWLKKCKQFVVDSDWIFVESFEENPSNSSWDMAQRGRGTTWKLDACNLGSSWCRRIKIFECQLRLRPFYTKINGCWWSHLLGKVNSQVYLWWTMTERPEVLSLY